MRRGLYGHHDRVYSISQIFESKQNHFIICHVLSASGWKATPGAINYIIMVEALLLIISEC